MRDPNQKTAADAKRTTPAGPEAVVWPPVPQGNILPILAMQPIFNMIERWPAERIEQCQLLQAHSLIKHAYRTVPFYREKLKQSAELESGQLTMELFRQIPISSRSEVRAAGNALTTNNLPSGHGQMGEVSTSGSTGQPLRIKTTGLSGMFFKAQGLRHHLWHQRDTLLKNMTIKAFDPDVRVRVVGGWATGLPSGPSVQVNFSLPATEILDAVIEHDPDYIQVHPSTLHELLRLSRKKDRIPRKLREVRTIGEALEDDLRRSCMDVWGVPIANNYSAQELNILALQCPDNSENLHIQSESVLLEVLKPDDTPCEPGEMGRCVATQLVNFAAPLIRYDFGDYATMGEQCSCGRGLPILTRVAGRERNLVTLEDGSRMMPRMTLDELNGRLRIDQFQLVQTSYRDIDVKLVAEQPLDKAQEKQYLEKLASNIPYGFNFHLSYHDEIPRLASGKYEIFRCEVDRDKAM